MKKLIAAALVAVLLASGLLMGCGGILKGSGDLETRQFDFSDFTKVDISSAFEFEIIKSDSYDINITADDNLFEHILVSKEGKTLKIGLKTVSIRWPATLKAEITMPQLRGLELSGATRGTVSGFSSAENLEIEVSGASSAELVEVSTGGARFSISGASKVTGDISTGDAEFDISGASTLQLEGSAGDIEVEASGASRVELAGFPVDNAKVSLSGASIGTVNLSGKLDANLGGASKLEYIGEPTMGNINTSGSSTLGKK